MLRRFGFIFLIVFAMALGACSSDNKGTTNVGNPSTSSESSTITISKVTVDGKVSIKIPEAIFGGAENISGASIALFVNNVKKYSGINAETYYNATTGLVGFTISGIKEGDIILVTITLSSSASASYEGTVSDEGESDAVLTSGSALGASSDSWFVDNYPLVITSNSDGSNEVKIGFSAFDFSKDQLEGAYVIASLDFQSGSDFWGENIKFLVSDYFDEDSSSIIFSLSDEGYKLIHDLGDAIFYQIEFYVVRADGSRRKFIVNVTDVKQQTQNYKVSYSAFSGTNESSFIIERDLKDKMTISYSEGCTAEFMLEHDFFVDSSRSDAELQAAIDVGSEEIDYWNDTIKIYGHDDMVAIEGFGEDSRDYGEMYATVIDSSSSEDGLFFSVERSVSILESTAIMIVHYEGVVNPDEDSIVKDFKITAGIQVDDQKCIIEIK
ncbi:MAG: hypothetical protein H7A33_05985 [Deltaproteobacteria bacterium]|nr:hypothetical protein [Deltaproteobacteria bacterium]